MLIAQERTSRRGLRAKINKGWFGHPSHSLSYGMLAQRRRFEMALQSAVLFSFRPVIDAAQSALHSSTNTRMDASRLRNGPLCYPLY